ncbi:MAG: SGNH/GDSL hydrolase family protein [Planctomycetota bacterium]
MKKRPLRVKLLALLLAVLSAFFVAEVAVRILRPGDVGQLQDGGTDDIKKGIRLRPAVKVFDGVPHRINQAGFHDDEEVPAKPAGEKRVLFIGDSFMYGAKLHVAETLPGRCETRLQAALGPSIRTIDLACPGWGTYHHLLAFREHQRTDVPSPPVQPDVVVLCFFVGNDIAETLQADRPDEGDAHSVVVLAKDGELVLEKRATRPHMKVLRLSKLFRLWETTELYKSIARGKSREETRESTLVEDAYWKIERFRMEHWRKGVSAKPLLAEAWTLVAKNLRALVAEVRAAGARPAIVLIPDEVQVDARKRAEVCRRFQVDEKDFELDEPQRRVAALAAELSVPCVDTLPAFREKGAQGGLYFDLDTHWNAKGHDLASELVAPVLETLLK